MCVLEQQASAGPMESRHEAINDDRYRDRRKHKGTQNQCRPLQQVTQDQVEGEQRRKHREPDHQGQLMFGGRPEGARRHIRGRVLVGWRSGQADSWWRWGVAVKPNPGLRSRTALRGRVNGRTVIPLTRQPDGMQAWKILISSSNVTPEPWSHDGEEWIYVLSGQMRFVLDDKGLVLGPGDVAAFDTKVPHWFGSTGDAPAEILSIWCDQANA